MGSPNSQWDSINRGRLPEVIRFRIALSAVPRWDSHLVTAGGDTERGHGEKVAICKPGGVFSPGTESATTLMLDVPASRTMRNKRFLFKPSPIYY